LKPKVYTPAPEPARVSPLRDKIERFLSGGRPPSDPLYLSNRTWLQKLRLAFGIALPLVVLLGALALVFTNVFAPARPAPKEPTAKEILAKLLPDLENTVQIDTYKDAEFLQLHVRRSGPPALVGLLRNKTSHVVSVEFSVYLANIEGGHVGTVTERVDKAPPGETVPFEFPLGDSDAFKALVLSAHTVL
jgi:hypothetical protein